MLQRLNWIGRRLLGVSQRHFIWLASIVALLFIAALVYASDQVVRDQITVESRAHAIRTARLLARSVYAPALERAAPGTAGLTPALRAQLDSATTAGVRSGAILGVVVWDRRGGIVYANRHRLIDRHFSLSPETVSAFRGAPTSRLEHPGGAAPDYAAERIEVNLPLHITGATSSTLVLEIAVPYAEVAADINQRTTRLDRIVLAAGALVYLLMVPLLIWAGRALRTQFDPRRRHLVERLRAAMANDELRLEFQPLVDLRTGVVKSAEALVRWHDPRHGRIAPDEFIPVVEASPFFWDFSLHVIELALRECAACRRKGIALAVAVNISAGNLLDERLPGELRRLLGKYELPAQALELEVTEGAIMEESERAATVLRTLAEVGVGRIAIDDFGTGYSSLARVHSLPIDAVKIDRSFIAEMDASGDSAMVRSMIALAHNLGLLVVAEGIETHETWGRLARLGCDLGQGYCISRPLPADELYGWLLSYEPGARTAHEESEDDRRRGPGRRRNDYFAVAFDNAPEPMLIADDAGRWVDANVAACELLRVSRETLRLRRWGAFSPSRSAAQLKGVWEELLSEGHVRGGWSVATADGRQVATEFEATANFLPGLHLFVVREAGVPAPIRSR